MLIDIPDPAYTASARARSSFRLAAKLSLAFVVFLWAVELADGAAGLQLGRFGVQPRTFGGVAGVFLAPVLHGGAAHLAANSVPLLVLGTGMLYLYPASTFRVLPAVYAGPGLEAISKTLVHH